MKRILALFLSIALLVTAVPVQNMAIVKADNTTTRTKVTGGDSDWADYLLINSYINGESKFKDPSYTELREDYPSLYEEQTGIYSAYNTEKANRWPYIAFTIEAEVAGTYNLIADTRRTTSYTIGIIVDGMMYMKDQSTETITQSVYLTAGAHVVVFTTPMPRDMESRPSTTGTSSQYPWTNYFGFEVTGVGATEGKVSFGNKPDAADIQNTMTSYGRMEAEDETCAKYNGSYNTEVSKSYQVKYNKDGATDTTEEYIVRGANGSAIDGDVASAETAVNTTQTFASIEAGLDKTLTSYVEYKVKAETAGTYMIRVGAYLEGSGTMPYGTIQVNDSAYQAQFSGKWNGWDAVNLPVELKAGWNTIRCIGVTADQTGTNGWIGYDYLDVQSGLLVGCSAIAAENSEWDDYLLLNKYAHAQKEETDDFYVTNSGDTKWDYPSLYEEMLGIYHVSDTSLAKRWSYIAFSVQAKQAGIHRIETVVDNNSCAVNTIGMIVDGAMYVLEIGENGEAYGDVYLSAGKHVIIFTTQMPRDAKETLNFSSNYAAIYDKGARYQSFLLSSGLVFGEKPTDADIQEIMTSYIRVEAEGTSYATLNGNYTTNLKATYTSRRNNATLTVVGADDAAIDGNVTDSEKSINTTQTYEDIAAGKLDKEKTSYIQYVVKAEKAGKYVLRIGAYVEGSGTMPYGTVLVNGEAYKAQFSGNWNGYDAVNLAVKLKEGINTIQCVGVTADQTSVDTAWIGYDYLDIPEGLTSCDIELKATDDDWDNYLYLNRYKVDGTSFGGPNYDDMRWDFPSLYEDMLGIYSDIKPDTANRWPYIAFTVRAEQAGEYQISANIKVGNANYENNASAKTVGMIVDGAMHVVEITTSSGTLTESVYLTEGEHVVIFTSPIFRDMVTRPTTGTNGNSIYYHYMNFNSFKLSAGLSFREAPSDADIQTAMTNYSRVEAEGTLSANGSYNAEISKGYVSRYNSPYTVKVKGATGAAINGSVSSDEKTVNTTQTYDEVAAGLDQNATSYVQYQVYAGETGTYVIRVGAYIEGSGTIPYGTVLVNGEAYKAQFSGNWNGYDAVNLAVELREGINTIQCIGVTADQTDTDGWIGYDYLDIPEGLTSCDIEVKVTDKDWDNYLLLNMFTASQYSFGVGNGSDGNTNYGHIRYDYPSLYEEMIGIYSDAKPDRANWWPYIAFTVYTEQAGEYQISANINRSTVTTLGMVVDGATYVIDETIKEGEVTASVYLTEGEHVIIFTAQIPRDMVGAPEKDDTLYPWINYKSFKISSGLYFVGKPAPADIQTAMTSYLRVEAEDPWYVSANKSYDTDETSKDYVRRYNTYTVKVKGTGKNVNTTQNYADIANGTLDKDLTSYIQYVVKADKAGKYVLRIGSYLEGSGTMPYGTILVNGNAYKAQFTGDWNGYDAVNLPVELQAGENIIQCIGVTADQTGTDGWIGYDYLEIPRELNYHEPGEYTNTSVESGLAFERRTIYETDGSISRAPYSISTWIYLPSGCASCDGVIFGNYKDDTTPCVSFEINENGAPRFYHINSNGDVVDLVFDQISIIADEWTNLTYTISGNTVSCYKNGVLAGTKTSTTGNIDMSAVKNQYVLGGDLRQAEYQLQTNQKYFNGRIIDIALYAKALTEDEILNVYRAEEIATQPYTRYELENAEEDKDVPDIIGNNNLDAKVSYFTEKEEVKNYAYSFAVIGDTQIVTENDVNKNVNNLSKIYDWILANQEQKNIKYVFGLGDITDNNTTAEWNHAKEQISKLDGKIPYSVVRGNHDLVGACSAEDKTADYMTQYLGTDAYKGQFAEGGFYDANISNSWRTFTVGEVDYLMLALDYGPSDDVLNWAGNIIKNHPEHSVIITTHAYLYRDGTTLDAQDTCPPSTSGGVNNGDDMWTKLVSKYENIVLVMSGHDPCDNIVMSRDVGVNGNIVTSLLIDPQGVDVDDGSKGMLAMLYFSEDGTEIQVEYFSTVTNEYFKEENQFSFEFQIDDCERIVKPYSKEQVIELQKSGDYPKDVEGYLFAGWYTDEACDEASLLKDATPIRTTYALFVPKHVLGVKAQISGNLLDNKTDNDGTASIRFVTTVDTLLYKKVGFEISYTDASGQKQEFESANGTVYQKLYAINSASKIDNLIPKKYFCGLSTYFKACTITEIPKDYYDTVFTIKPFWITMDGAKVYGDTETKTVNMGIPKN